MSKKEQIIVFLNELIDPSSKKTLLEQSSIKVVTLEEDVCFIKIAITNRQKDETNIKLSIVKFVKVNLGIKGIRIEFEEVEKEKQVSKVKYLAIASGKGGVGKSSVTANLAYAMSLQGKKVGIIDADLYGASIPSILKLPVLPLESDEDDQLIPAETLNMQVISTEFFMPENQPLMWRGPMLSKLLVHFFEGTIWDPEIEYILIDLPPGTGDVTLDVQEFMPSTKVLIVTTPHPNAAHVAVKAGLGAKEIGHDVIGVVENMSYYYDNVTKRKINIFGEGGGLKTAQTLNTELLAQLPIEPVIEHETYLYDSNHMIGKFYTALAIKVMDLLK